jgi:hypothetical protein
MLLQVEIRWKCWWLVIHRITVVVFAMDDSSRDGDGRVSAESFFGGMASNGFSFHCSTHFFLFFSFLFSAFPFFRENEILKNRACSTGQLLADPRRGQQTPFKTAT